MSPFQQPLYHREHDVQMAPRKKKDQYNETKTIFINNFPMKIAHPTYFMGLEASYSLKKKN